MNKLVEMRSLEYACRERATLDSERKAFWLAQAEEWEQRASTRSPITSGNAISVMTMSSW